MIQNIRKIKSSKKILVVGCSGGGKSTLSLALSKQLELPVYHLDKHYWKPGWLKPERHFWYNEVETLVSNKQWIIDGSYASTLHLRLPVADTVIWLQMPRTLCLARAIQRRFKQKNRPDMADGCNERIDWDFYKYIWNFEKTQNPRIDSAIKEFGKSESLIIIKGPTQLKFFYNQLNLDFI